MSEYIRRGYRILISVDSLGADCKVETKLFSPPGMDGRDAGVLRAASTRYVPAAPIETLLQRALDSVKITADFLAARSAALTDR